MIEHRVLTYYIKYGKKKLPVLGPIKQAIVPRLVIDIVNAPPPIIAAAPNISYTRLNSFLQPKHIQVHPAYIQFKLKYYDIINIFLL